MKKAFWFCVLWCFSISLFGQAQRFDLLDGDRVAFVGGTFMEREQEENYVETMLTRAFPDRNVTFRNLGWSGDTVHSFLNPNIEPRPKYVPTVFDYVAKLKPTVIFVSYGMMESFDGADGLPEFVKNYNIVLDKLSATTRRIVIVSPFHHEKLGGQWPDPENHNRSLKLYVEAIQKIASERGFTFINLFDSLPTNGKKLLTNNGVHLTNDGYVKAALTMARQLGLRISEKDFLRPDALREAIKDKNKQWWYHYRPMNSEYVYPGGERYQVKIGPVDFPMYSEIEEFAKLAEAGDAKVAALRKNPKMGRAIVKKPLTISRAAQRDPSAPDPAEERKAFKISDGLNVDLFAADPLIDKPVQMAFDDRGRLWVATTTLYPHIKPGEKASDKIIILEDKNGDGKADKATVFADDLYIPTAILPTRDGCYVSDDTKIYLYRDTDGDGRADSKEIVLSGFGTEDSHHKAHVFRWGPEGNLYFNISVFLHNTFETPHGIVAVSGHWLAGIMSYRPEAGKLDVHLASSTPPNPWGHYWNRWGFDFHIDSSGQQGSNFILPTSNRSSTAIQVTGGQGKLAGAEIISGRHFPDDWQGNLVSSPFKENRVSRWQFSDDSSGFALTPLQPLIESTDNSFRPVDEVMGPDGALYILDWYNPLIGHMQYHFRDPGRDKTHGRIWRITAKDRPLVKPPQFVGASTRTIVNDLKAPETYTRAKAKRALAERAAKEVMPVLQDWVKGLRTNDPDYDHHVIEALWTCENLNVVEPDLLNRALHAKDPNARAAATATIRRWCDRLDHPLELLAKQVTDENPRVRLEAVISLSYLQEPRAIEIATRALDSTMDRYLDEALRNTSRALKPIWLPAFTAGKLGFDGNPKHVDFALQAVGSKDAVKPLLGMITEQKLSGPNLVTALALIGGLGDASDLAAICGANYPVEAQSKVITALVKAARERKIIPQVDTARLNSWLSSANDSVKAEALRLAGAWKRTELESQLLAAATDGNSGEIRAGAVEGIAAFENEFSLQTLSNLTAAEKPMDVRCEAIVGLAARDLKLAGTAAATLLENDSSGVDVSRIFRAFLQHKQGIETLGQALAKGKINVDNAKVGLRVVNASGQQNAALTKALSEAAGLSSEMKELSREELLSWVSEVQTKGNAARGEQIFHRDELTCFKCHAIAGAGGQVGPDLSAVGGGSTVDYLIESILTPNKIIKDGFETIEVTTTQDDYYLGIRVRENRNEIVLKDATHSELTISKERIRERKNKKVSLMPAGLTSTLTHAEFIDLVRFLSELGKPGPYANNPKALVRRWRLSDGRNGWIPAYSFVSGDLVPEFPSAKRASAARCDLEVTTPGKIALSMNSVSGLKLSVDEKVVDLKDKLLLDLSRGTHTFHFEIDPSRTQALHAEFEQVAGSSGRFQVVGGP